jgi:hypothetical protein
LVDRNRRKNEQKQEVTQTNQAHRRKEVIMKYFWIILLFPALLFAAEPIEKHPEWDQDYSKQIREYTTGPQFMTDLVDHLPASDKVPSPLKFNGYIAGAPDHLTYAEDVYRYMRALESATPRVKVFSIGKTEEGREMILVIIANEETIAKLDEYKEINRKLSDPRKITDQQAAELVKQGKPMYWLTGAMHSPETGSPEMLMELAYRLAVEDTPMIQNIRNNVITMITPVLEVDGRDRMVDLVRWKQANPNSTQPPLVYWGHYVAHDDNRDYLGLTLKLTQNILKGFLEYHPQVLHDLHESIPFLYISTGTGPYNAWLDPIAIDEWHRMAYNEVQTLTAKGLPGVWTHGFYDGWAPNYMFWIAHGHNALGRFYETFGNSTPKTMDRVVRDTSQRDWYRPNPPLPQVKWSLRNNVNYQQSGVLTALNYTAENHEHMLELYWDLGKRAIAKATTEGPAAYVFEANQNRKGQLRDLLNLLRAHGIEIQQTEKPVTVKLEWPPKKPDQKKEDEANDTKDKKEEKKEPESVTFSSGSYVVRMDQPFSRLADALLDVQYVRGDERVYDDCGWTLGYSKNVEWKRVVNQEILKTPMHEWNGQLTTTKPSISGKVVAIRNFADTDLVRLRYALPSAKFSISEAAYKEKTADWPAGTVWVSLEGADSTKILDALSTTALDYSILSAQPQIAMHEMPIPRLAVLHSWLDTQDEGWYRVALDELHVSYDYISTQDVSKMADLRSKYDVILFPPTGGFTGASEIVNGYPGGTPMPWKKTELTPNLGVDETGDMRAGLGLSGVENLSKFVQDGGLLITVRETAEWAVQYGLAKYITTSEPQKLRASGSILKAVVSDKKSPVIAGYEDTLPVYYAGFSIFKVGIFSNRESSKRPSGRGSLKDPDVPQGRPYVELPERPKDVPGGEGFVPPDESSSRYDPYIPKIEDRPRVILSFPKQADQIFMSGMLDGADEIAGKPIVIDSPLGKGHVLLFANNPIWRGNTQGDYALIFNAILNYQNLGFGWPPK